MTYFALSGDPYYQGSVHRSLERGRGALLVLGGSSLGVLLNGRFSHPGPPLDLPLIVLLIKMLQIRV